MRWLLIGLLLVPFFTASAQETPIDTKVKFGEVSLEDFQKKTFGDTLADAVVLFDYGECGFEVLDGVRNLVFYYHKRIKILRKSALDRATLQLSYIKSGKSQTELLEHVKGFTYNLQNGQVVREKLRNEMIFEEKLSNDIVQTKFTLPNVVEGSIFEYSYIIHIPFSISNNPPSWAFQGELPVVWSEFRILIPEWYTYKILLGGYLPLHINQTQQTNIWLGSQSAYAYRRRFVVKDAPPFRNEPFITTPSDYISKIEFELASVGMPGKTQNNYSLDYPTLNKTLLEEETFGETIKNTAFLKDIAINLKKNASDTITQVKAAYDFVRRTVKWNNEFGIFTDFLQKVVERQKGDVGDINLLLVALLREMGFDANPVLLSTRLHGKVDESNAILKRFNYVVAHIVMAGKDLLLDASDEHLKMGVLPPYCLNHIGFLVHPTTHRFVSLEPTEKDIEYKKGDFSLNEAGELTGTFMKSYGGYSDWSIKKILKNEGKDKFIEGFKKAKPTWTITKMEFANTNELDKSTTATYQVSINDYVTKVGNILYLKPMLSEGHNENPFKAAERNFPIDFGYQMEETFMATYELPTGYSMAEAPKNVVVNLPNGGGRFAFVVSTQEQKIVVNSRIQLKKALYAAEDYGALREFFDKIVEKHNQQIVLKKL
ncbi:MAG: DUF3857 domain-containing protein [Spirosomataceae bacterium]